MQEYTTQKINIECKYCYTRLLNKITDVDVVIVKYRVLQKCEEIL